MKLSIAAPADAFKENFGAVAKPIAAAATRAVATASTTALAEAKATIGAAGFSKYWQDGLRLKTYPSGGKVSINAAGWFSHKNNLALVFEEGRSIRGKPMLWLPLSSTPKKMPDGRRTEPNSYAKSFGGLFSVNRPGKPPLLFGQPFGAAKESRGFTHRNKRKAPKLRPSSHGAVPLFFGVSAVELRKKWRIYETLAKAADKLPGLFEQNLKVD